MGASISSAVRVVAQQQPDYDAVLLMTCDQPHVSSATIDRLIAEYQASGKAIAASGYVGTIGVPAVFGRAYFAALAQLQPDKGAKEILLRHREDVAVVEFEPGAVDLDTPADYERFTRGDVTS